MDRANIDDIAKLAKSFEESFGNDIMEEISIRHEANKLARIAGELLYKASKVGPEEAEKLRHAGKLVLAASDVLKKL